MKMPAQGAGILIWSGTTDQLRTVMQEMSARFRVAADGFGLVPLEPGETGPVKLAIVLGEDRLGERVGLAEQAAGRAAGGVDALLGFVLALSAPTWTIQPLWVTTGLVAGSSGSAAAQDRPKRASQQPEWARGRGGRHTPRMPLPVPKPAG